MLKIQKFSVLFDEDLKKTIRYKIMSQEGNTYSGINPLSMLVMQNRTYNPEVLNQAQEIFLLIGKAILRDQNFIEFDMPIYQVNRFILANKGYYVIGNRIVWNEYLEMLNDKNLCDKIDNSAQENDSC